VRRALEAVQKTDGIAGVALAMVHTGRGEKKQAVELLRQAADAHVTDAMFIGVDPVFDPLRGDPDFQALSVVMAGTERAIQLARQLLLFSRHEHGTPRPLDLGPIATLTSLGQIPYFRMILVWTLFALLLIAIFWLTHGGFGELKTQLSLMIDGFNNLYH